MGINWGVALGSAAKAGTDTYLKLQEEARLAERARQAEEQFKAWQADQAERTAIREAGKNTYGRVGTTDYSRDLANQTGIGNQQAQALSLNTGDPELDKLQAERDAETLRANAASKGALPSAMANQPVQMKGETYTRERAQKDYLQSLYGISPEKAIEMEGKGLQLNAARREDDLGQKRFELMTTFATMEDKVNTAVKNNDVGAYVNIVGPEYAKATGSSVALVTKPDGTQVVQVTPKKGKPTELPADVKSLHASVGPMMQEEFVRRFSLLDPKYGLEARKVKADEKRTDTDEEFKVGKDGKPGVYERVQDKEDNAKVTAARINAEGKSIKVRAEEYADAIIASGENNPKTQKPYTREEAIKYAYSILTKDPNAKKDEWKVSTDGSFRSNSDGSVVQDFDPKTNTWKTRGLPTVSEAAAKVGVVGDVDRKTGRPAFKGADGWYSTEQEAFLSFNRRNTDKPASALPAGDNKHIGQRFGPLTSRAIVEEAARNGNPDAIRYLNALRQNEIDLETARQNNGLGFQP